MKVKELIEMLKQYDQEKEIKMDSGGTIDVIEGIYESQEFIYFG